jgi:transcription antitermination factor NusG
MFNTILEKEPGIVVPNNNQDQDGSWYAIYTKSRFEKKVYRDLVHSNFQVFLPLVTEKKHWSDRIKSVAVPLFPSYVFVKARMQNPMQLHRYPGVVKIVSFEGKPCKIREEEIRLMERIIKSGFPVQQTNVCTGDQVRIKRGPLQGWEGKVEDTRRHSRIVFQFASIRQCISVEVNMEDVEILNDIAG